MAQSKHDRLVQDLLGLKLNYISENYKEVLDEAARKNTPMLDVLLHLFGGQSASRRDNALARRVQAARLPVMKTLTEFATGEQGRWTDATPWSM